MSPKSSTLALLLLMGLASGQQKPPDVIGFVSTIDGKWVRVVEQNKPLDAGDFIYAGDKIASRNKKHASIHIGLLDGTVWQREVCANGGRCDDFEETVQSQLAAPNSTGDSLWAQFKRYFRPDRPTPVMFVTARSAMSSAALQPGEAVLLYAGGRVDLAPALAGLPVGTYQISLTWRDDDSHHSSQGPVGPFSIRWRQQTSVAIPDLLPGLYALDVAAPGAEAATSAVLVTIRHRFAEAARMFHSAEQLVARWNAAEAIDPDTSHLLRTRMLMAVEARLADR